jgi:hypothetical protein
MTAISKVLLRLGLFAGVLLISGEISVRVLTNFFGNNESNLNGMPRIGKVPLLPFRPEPGSVGKWWEKSASSRYVVHDKELGWTIGPSVTVGDYSSNSQGIRTNPNRNYDIGIPPSITRLIVVGDSFTHGDESSLENTWTSQLERIDSRFEVLNFGVPGYGTDQAFLRWRRDAQQFKSSYVVLGIWPENICRNLNVIRYFLVPSGGYSPKPRFRLDQGKLTLINSPVPEREELISILRNPDAAELLKDEYWFRKNETTFPFYYHSQLVRMIASITNAYTRRVERNRIYAGQDLDGIEITVAIATQFAYEVRATGAIPLVLVLPMKELLVTYSAENQLPLSQSLRNAGLNVIDPTHVFARKVVEDGEGKYFAEHLTPAGNRLLAEEVFKYLSSRTDRTIESSK